jgi:hypothetical protein
MGPRGGPECRGLPPALPALLGSVATLTGLRIDEDAHHPPAGRIDEALVGAPETRVEPLARLAAAWPRRGAIALSGR